jgi:hypothetical protein
VATRLITNSTEAGADVLDIQTVAGTVKQDAPPLERDLIMIQRDGSQN